MMIHAHSLPAPPACHGPHATSAPVISRPCYSTKLSRGFWGCHQRAPCQPMPDPSAPVPTHHAGSTNPAWRAPPTLHTCHPLALPPFTSPAPLPLPAAKELPYKPSAIPSPSVPQPPHCTCNAVQPTTPCLCTWGGDPPATHTPSHAPACCPPMPDLPQLILHIHLKVAALPPLLPA